MTEQTFGIGPVTIDEDDRRVVIRLDRPEARNAIDLATIQTFHAVCEILEDRPRILVVTGSAGMFASGADLRELRERRRDDALKGINSTLFDRLHRLPMPTIAAVSGPALGGGAELAYACDFRIAVPGARFGNPEPALGILAAAGACWRLKELVGEAIANEVLLAGRILSAEEALACRLVSEIVPPDELAAAVEALVDRILRSSPLALRLTKLAMRMPAGSHPDLDNVAQAVLFETTDKHERITDFLERRSAARAAGKKLGE
ncbi:MAG TPA: enoyl-CoA hydratase/isomerase family protein [Acidimicrobiales bacterium]|jgi:enoyl-CoA hydratase|nr:enoyl-CoA hydratase/isomerase family protein [Acidimicrobiales bacterium]